MRVSGSLLAMLSMLAFLLASACRDGGGEPTATLAPATGKIAFVSAQEGDYGDYDLYVMNADGSGQTFLTRATRTQISDPSWSPDGSRIAFERGSEIYVMNADGSGHTKISDDHPYVLDESPAWSPDGARIAFASIQRTFEEDRRKDHDIYVMNADGSNVTRLTDDPAIDLSPGWSPDGTRIAFISNREQRWDLYIMNADGSKQTLLVESVSLDSAPAWSPDGTRIAFVGLPAVIYVINADGSGQTRLTEKGFNFDPTWSPDGKHIAFASALYSGGGNLEFNDEVYVMNADGSGQTRLTDNPGDDRDPAWMPAP